MRSTWKKAVGCPDHVRQPHRDRTVPAQSNSAFFGSRRYAQSMARPTGRCRSLAQPASPMPMPATNGFLRMKSIPTMNITDSASLCAPAYRPDRDRVGHGEQRGPGLAATVSVGQQHRPGADDDERHCREHLRPEDDVVHVLPAGWPAAGSGSDRSVRSGCRARAARPTSTGSNWPRNTSAGEMSYGLMPIACRRRPRTSARRRRSSRHGDGQQGERGAEAEDRRAPSRLPAVGQRPHGDPQPTAPIRIASQIRMDTSHSFGSRTPAGRYHGGSSESRGPSVMVTAEGPRNPASKVEPGRRDDAEQAPAVVAVPDRGPVGRLGGLGGVADRRFVAVIRAVA